MTAADLWRFVQTQGFAPREVGIAAFGLLLLALGLWLGYGTARTPRPGWTYGAVLTPLLLAGLAGVCGLVSWALARERYLLRPGAGRYTVGVVDEHYTQRGRQKFVCVYHVARQRWQTGQACGIARGQDLPCPALQTRRYVYFAPEDPGIAQLTAVPVPDSVRTIPPLGWARIP